MSILALVAMTLGGAIYICFRAESLTMFHWFNTLGLEREVWCLRRLADPLRNHIPEAVIYSLPNALWYLSGLLVFRSIWGVGTNRNIWIGIFSLFAIGSELAQGLGVVQGVFDPLDLTFMLGGGGIYLALDAIERKGGNHEVAIE